MSSFRKLLSRPFGWLIAVAGFLCLAVPLAWATMVIYYSNLPWAAVRIGLAAAFGAFVIWAVWFSRQRSMSLLAVVLFFGVVGWWISIRPSHDRNWRPEVSVMPRATIDGDHVHLTGVRNFQYRSRNDFTVGYQERDVFLSHLVALDFYVSYFTEGPVGHTFLSFIFDNAPAAADEMVQRAKGEPDNPEKPDLRDRLLRWLLREIYRDQYLDKMVKRNGLPEA
jgi:hypothetical protein